jgi:hypothetical protein
MEVAVSIADACLPVEENLLIDRDTLASSISFILRNDPDALAGLFVELRHGIESGFEGITRTRNTLAVAVELVYLHTQAHDAALKLYQLSQEGQLKVEDEPVRLIGAAIERQMRNASESEHKRVEHKRRGAHH